MKDDLTNLDNNELPEDNAGAKAETNDSWEFEATAHTLENTFVENDEYEIEIPSVKDTVREKPQPKAVPKAKPSRKSDSVNITKFLITAIFVVIIVFVCVLLGVRYYTFPETNMLTSAQVSEITSDNWADGEKLTPGNVALTVDGIDVSVGMYNFYYNSIANDYITYATSYDIDTSIDYDKQFTTDDDGKEISWQQKFEDDTVYQITYVSSLYKKAVESGITLSDDDVETIKANLDSIVSSAEESDYGSNVDEYIAANYGNFCGYNTIARMLYQSFLARTYYYQVVVETKCSDEETQEYYSQHKNDCMTQSFSYLMLEYTDDDSQDSNVKILDEVKKDAEKYADEIDAGKTVEDKNKILKDLIPTACADLISEYISYYDVTESEAIEEIAANYSSAELTADDATFTDEGIEWLFNEDVKSGDTGVIVDSTNYIVYVVLKTGEPQLLDETIYSVRHLLVTPEVDDEEEAETDEYGNTVYSDESWEEAEAQANEILEEFNKGDKSEYSFALLAEKYSSDTYSTSNGGQGYFGGYYGGVSQGEMVSEFEEWSLDSSRTYGDVEIVKTEYGYHLMFFIENTSQYLYKCSQAVIVDKCEELINGTVDNANVVRHKLAMKNVTVAQPTDSTEEEAQESAFIDDSDNMDY